ncbi:hypothetical protein TUMEXPCC7403_18130 [Tumidithrix helvetica PCC 7403]
MRYMRDRYARDFIQDPYVIVVVLFLSIES